MKQQGGVGQQQTVNSNPKNRTRLGAETTAVVSNHSKTKARQHHTTVHHATPRYGAFIAICFSWCLRRTRPYCYDTTTTDDAQDWTNSFSKHVPQTEKQNDKNRSTNKQKQREQTSNNRQFIIMLAAYEKRHLSPPHHLHAKRAEAQPTLLSGCHT